MVWVTFSNMNGVRPQAPVSFIQNETVLSPPAVVSRPADPARMFTAVAPENDAAPMIGPVDGVAAALVPEFVPDASTA